MTPSEDTPQATTILSISQTLCEWVNTWSRWITSTQLWLWDPSPPVHQWTVSSLPFNHHAHMLATQPLTPQQLATLIRILQSQCCIDVLPKIQHCNNRFLTLHNSLHCSMVRTMDAYDTCKVLAMNVTYIGLKKGMMVSLHKTNEGEMSVIIYLTKYFMKNFDWFTLQHKLWRNV